MGPMISGGMAFSEVSLWRLLITLLEADDDLVTKASAVGAAMSNAAVTTFEENFMVSFCSIGVISFQPES